jgi:hypothetical protein
LQTELPLPNYLHLKRIKKDDDGSLYALFCPLPESGVLSEAGIAV